MKFGDVHLAFDKRLPELETAGDPAPTAAAPAFEAAIAEVPSTNILPLPHDFHHLASPPSPFPTWQRRMRFRGLKFDSDTSGAAAVFATVRSGAARRNQEI